MNARQPQFVPVYRVPEPPLPECSLTTGELFRVLRDRVGPGDLRLVLHHVEAIYDAPAEVHWDAAAALESRAHDVCLDFGVSE